MRALLAALILCATVTVADAAASPTDDERAACTPDARKFCKAEFDKLFAALRIYSCLSGHRQQLSPKCDAVFKAHGL
jgi:hypothetical protein